MNVAGHIRVAGGRAAPHVLCLFVGCSVTGPYALAVTDAPDAPQAQPGAQGLVLMPESVLHSPGRGELLPLGTWELVDINMLDFTGPTDPA
jgi:hypothetical protein